MLSYLPLVKSLVCCNSHPNLIANTEENEASLGQVESDLTNNLIKALREEFFTDGADAALSSLAFHQLLVKHLSESRDIDSGSGLMAHILNPLFAIFGPLSWREHSVEYIFLLRFACRWWELSFLRRTFFK